MISSFLEPRQDQSFQELLELLRFPSVSTDPGHKNDLERCAAWVLARLEAAGLEARLFPTPGHPVVYAEKIVADTLPTVLVYGHYDVQPPDPVDLWRHAPFDPTVEGEYVVARGASDDKGQFFSLVLGIEAYLATRDTPGVNVKVLLEGEEEVGSPNLLPFVKKEKDRLACDVVVIADSSQFARDIPAITYGLKGLCYLELVVRAASRDLHSGSYGGGVPNAANALTRMMAACQGPFGKIAIPGFYDDVLELEPWEREAFAKLPFDDEKFRAELGLSELYGEDGYTTLERKWGRPTLDINGLHSGFTGEGAKTVLPCEARAKFSMRLVPNQDPETIGALVRAFLEEITPPGVTVEVLDHHGAKPVIVPRDGKPVQAAIKAYTTGFGREPVFVREGGSIPVVNTFQEELGAQSLLTGLGLPDDNLHAPNERFRVKDFHRGSVTMAAFLDELARIS